MDHFYEIPACDQDRAALPPKPGPTVSKVQDGKNWRKFVLWIVLHGITISLLAVLLIQLNLTTRQLNIESEELPSTSKESTQIRINVNSCKELLAKQSNSKDGVYWTTPKSAKIEEFQTYCDMTTDGGGWTLVASIRESSITQKCGPDDLWSEFLPTNANDDIRTNWENDLVFGDIYKCTENDYKNSGYYNIKAKDIMVWHVPGDTELSKVKQESTFRYRTNNTFINSRSLKDLFQDYELMPRSDIAKLYQERPLRVIKALLNAKQTITVELSSFESYTMHENYVKSTAFTATTNLILNNNRVTFKSPGCVHEAITYGTNYSCDDGHTNFNTSSGTNDIFFAIVAISNEDKSKTSFTIEAEVQKRAATRTYTYTSSSGNVTEDSYTIMYHMDQYVHTSWSSIVQFHFIVANEEEWGSDYRTPSADVTNTPPNVQLHKSAFTLGNTPTNAIMGYTLLTRTKGDTTTDVQAQNLAEIILRQIKSVKNLYKETTGFSVPVVFDTGNQEEFLNTIPEDLRSQVEPGFVQFRAYNFQGYANAFCPGIKTSTVMPQYVCIGGISDDIGEKGTCGDFAGWEGKTGDTPSSNDQAPGHAHSLNDRRSAILLFVR